MLGGQIGPKEQTLVIRQVVRQPLPRVIPEKMYIEVSHCYGWNWDTQSHICIWTVLLSTPTIHLWLATFCNLLVQIGSAFIGFMETWILASTTVQYTSHLESSVLRSRISYPSRPNLSTYSTLWNPKKALPDGLLAEFHVCKVLPTMRQLSH